MATSNPTGAGGASFGAAGGGDKGPESQISRLNLNQLKNQEQIIHRTQNCIIVAGQNKREEQEPVSYRFATASRGSSRHGSTQSLAFSLLGT